MWPSRWCGGGLPCACEVPLPSSRWDAAGVNGDWALVPAEGLLPFHALPGTNAVPAPWPGWDGAPPAPGGGVGGEGEGDLGLLGGVNVGNSEGGVSEEETGVELRLVGVLLGESTLEDEVEAVPEGIGMGAVVVGVSFAPKEGVRDSPSPVLIPSAAIEI